MAIYVCPTCGEKMERDLLLFINHTDAHVVEELKKKHPEWITDDGFCAKCLAHYKAVMSGEKAVTNIGGGEITKRVIFMVVGLAVSAALYAVLARSAAPRSYRLLLFIPLFAMSLGFFQAKSRQCVVLGMKGTRNAGHGEEPVKDSTEKKLLRVASFNILLCSALLSAVLTGLAYLIR